ncbi:MAG: polysaccharide deacetylase family protein [Traorella sp.]
MKKVILLLIVIILQMNLVGCQRNENNAVMKTETFPSGLLNAKETHNLLVFKEDIPQDSEVVVSYEVAKREETYTGLPSLSPVTFTVKDPNNERNLSSGRISFSFGAASDGKPHDITINNQRCFDSYHTNALAWDNKTEEKVLYLTFDCGYEYQDLVYRILDTLQEKNVSAAFFCTQEFIEDDPIVVARMIQDGHIVGNHSLNHPENCAALTREELAKEVLGVHNYLRVNFGYNCRYFRFPTGAYSQNALELVNSVGYRSVFWSIAYADWDPENQPGVDVSFETVTSRLHPGAVILLHSTSPDNVAILADFIDYARNEGYVFKTLDEYSNWE